MTNDIEPYERLLVALDTPDADRARELAGKLAGRVGGLKIGLELFVLHGPELVRELGRLAPVFLDLKLHDIPNTVAGAAAGVGRLGVRWFTMHACGGAEMLQRGDHAAREAAISEGLEPPTSLGVTVLTSHDDASLARLGMRGTTAEAVERLAHLCRDAGMGGLVCSAHELELVRPVMLHGTIVVPGIRSSTHVVAGDDQARVASPAGAVARGADRLVIGRPITRAADPAKAAAEIAAEIARSEGSAANGNER